MGADQDRQLRVTTAHLVLNQPENWLDLMDQPQLRVGQENLFRQHSCQVVPSADLGVLEDAEPETDPGDGVDGRSLGFWDDR